MAETVFAVAASSRAVVMGIAPLLQIRRMLRERSSRAVPLGYVVILLIGFAVWTVYGVACGVGAVTTAARSHRSAVPTARAVS